MIIIAFWQTTNISWLGLVDGESWSIMVNILPGYWSSRERERQMPECQQLSITSPTIHHPTKHWPHRLAWLSDCQTNRTFIKSTITPHHTTSHHQPSCLLCTPTVLTSIKGRSLESPESRNRASFGVQKENSGFQKLGKGWKVKSPDFVWMKTFSNKVWSGCTSSVIRQN